MDESAFRQARGAVNPQPCAFEKALLARCGACSLAERRNIAEREAVACGSPPARERCAALLALLRQNSVFALKLTQADAPLPHAQAMKLQCGGLQGMQRAAGSAAALDGCAGTPASGAAEPAPVADVHGLLQACAEKFGGLQNLPYPVVIQSVVAYAIRRRRPAQ